MLQWRTYGLSCSGRNPTPPSTLLNHYHTTIIPKVCQYYTTVTPIVCQVPSQGHHKNLIAIMIARVAEHRMPLSKTRPVALGSLICFAKVFAKGEFYILVYWCGGKRWRFSRSQQTLAVDMPILRLLSATHRYRCSYMSFISYFGIRGLLLSLAELMFHVAKPGFKCALAFLVAVGDVSEFSGNLDGKRRRSFHITSTGFCSYTVRRISLLLLYLS